MNGEVKLSNKDLAIRKIKGVLTMVKIGNVEGFEICNMKATEKKLEEALSLLRRED